MRALILLTPRRFAVLCWTYLILAGALVVLLTERWDWIAPALLFPAFYGYPVWLVFASGLPTKSFHPTLVAAAIAVVAGAVLAALLVPCDTEVADQPWAYLLGILVGLALFTPQAAAAHVLRTAELKAGRPTRAGGISAFLWLFYFPFGWAPLHRRTRLASGLLDADDIETPSSRA